MGLRETAEADLNSILEDAETGFGWPIRITDPNGISANLIGFSNDVSNIIDPDTGQAISGQSASVALRISSLNAEGMATPRNISNTDLNPWVVEFSDINGGEDKFKVQESNPDKALGIVTCILELYEL